MPHSNAETLEQRIRELLNAKCGPGKPFRDERHYKDTLNDIAFFLQVEYSDEMALGRGGLSENQANLVGIALGLDSGALHGIRSMARLETKRFHPDKQWKDEKHIDVPDIRQTVQNHLNHVPHPGDRPARQRTFRTGREHGPDTYGWAAPPDIHKRPSKKRDREDGGGRGH